VPGVLVFSPTRLTELRTQAGLSREQLAVLVGRGYQTIRLYERGFAVPPTPIVARFATVLGVGIEEFFEDGVVAP
jgi:transcriptional regulator with XRE-family HTH domain